MTIYVKEGDGHRVTVTWKDGDGVAVTPTTCRYKVDCMTTGSARLSWTTIAAASSVTIDIPGTSNGIVNPANTEEVKQITIQANYGAVNQFTVTGEYTVQNNEFHS